jgi:hypothetical protein
MTDRAAIHAEAAEALAYVRQGSPGVDDPTAVIIALCLACGDDGSVANAIWCSGFEMAACIAGSHPEVLVELARALGADSSDADRGEFLGEALRLALSRQS